MFKTDYYVQPNYSFTDVWGNANDFINGNDELDRIGWKTCPFYEDDLISDKYIEFIYFLLYANYGNSHIASSDVNRFQFKLMSLVYQYGPLWIKKTEIQKRIRNLTEEEIRSGSKSVYITAQHDGSAPSTDSLEELLHIESQNVTKNQRGKLEGYGLLLELLKTDVTEEFVNKFKKLFQVVSSNECPILYSEEEEC